jgi:hypothetical protein
MSQQMSHLLVFPEGEITAAQRRLQVARLYPCESQIRTSGADFESWRDFRDAPFQQGR